MPKQTWKTFLVQKWFQIFDVNLNVLKEVDQKEFQLVQNFTMGDADLNQFIRLRNQLVIAAENFDRGENLSPLLIPASSRDLDEQLKVSHKVIYVAIRADG